MNEYAERTAESEKSAESWAHGNEDYPDRDEDNAKYYAEQAKKSAKNAGDVAHGISGQVEDAKKSIDDYAAKKEHDLKGETGNVYFAAFKVVNGRLIMFSDPNIDKVRFVRVGSRLKYRIAM